MAAKSISLDDDRLEAEATGLKVDIGDAAELNEAIETEGMRLEGETFRLDDVLCPSCPNVETGCACEALALRLPKSGMPWAAMLLTLSMTSLEVSG
jgi:hypothetical protein